MQDATGGKEKKAKTSSGGIVAGSSISMSDIQMRQLCDASDFRKVSPLLPLDTRICKSLTDSAPDHRPDTEDVARWQGIEHHRCQA